MKDFSKKLFFNRDGRFSQDQVALIILGFLMVVALIAAQIAEWFFGHPINFMAYLGIFFFGFGCFFLLFATKSTISLERKYAGAPCFMTYTQVNSWGKKVKTVDLPIDTEVTLKEWDSGESHGYSIDFTKNDGSLILRAGLGTEREVIRSGVTQLSSFLFDSKRLNITVHGEERAAFMLMIFCGMGIAFVLSSLLITF